MVEVSDKGIDATKLYDFLEQAKNSVLNAYEKQRSAYTREELKVNIKN